MKYSPSKNAERVAIQYLKHEFRKIFGHPTDKALWRKLDGAIQSLPKTIGEVGFWNLVAAISEGYKLKRVFHILSDSTYDWKLKSVPLRKIVLTGMWPAFDRYIIKKFDRDPVKFEKAWKKDAVMRRTFLRPGFEARAERDNFPIFLFETEDKLRVFDGMRRTLLALIAGKKTIQAWVGIRVRRGKPLVSTNRCWFLSNIYDGATKKDKDLERAIIKIGKEITSQSRNGREVLIKRIAGWSHDPDVKLFIKKIAAPFSKTKLLP